MDGTRVPEWFVKISIQAGALLEKRGENQFNTGICMVMSDMSQ
jgi:hypothetical protein